MKSNSERLHAGFHRFLAETGHEEPSEAEMDALLQEYVKIFNERARTLEPMPEEASADAFLDRAQEARELEPEHVDAALVEINMTAKEPCGRI